ncbi:MAG: hypothetical protein M1836_000387 [Candelina mexicana]|nr:MAG: hypothetical protein M1836_000387 [Candelina mexicana]
MASKLIPSCLRTCTRSIRIAQRQQCRTFAASTSRAKDTITVHRPSPTNNISIPFKFSSLNERLIQEILKRYPPQYKKAAVMPLLDLGQRQLGFCSISVMNEVARILEMPPMRVYEVATFYTMFNQNPVGKFHVQTPCQLCGSDSVVKAIDEHLKLEHGGTTPDNLFTVEEVECLGACVNGPMMQINDDYYEDLTPESTVNLLKALQASAEITGAGGGSAGIGGEAGSSGSGQDRNVGQGKDVGEFSGRVYDKGGVKLPSPGPMSGRKTCEPMAGLTSLTSEMWGKEKLRTDGEL